jgi:hypothetical protein
VKGAPAAARLRFDRRYHLRTTALALRVLCLDVLTSGEHDALLGAKEFLDDSRPDKKGRLVSRLLEHARFSNHLAVTLRETLLPGADNDPVKRNLVPGFEGWLRLRLSDGVPYD